MRFPFSFFTGKFARATTLASLMMLCQSPSLSAADGNIEMSTTPNEVFGTIEIETGEYESGIRKSLAILPNSLSKARAAAYANLCIGHLKLGELNKAESYCQKGTEEAWYTWIGYINRGAFNYVRGQYAASMADYARALELKPWSKAARANLAKAQAKFAENGGSPQQLASE